MTEANPNSTRIDGEQPVAGSPTHRRTSWDVVGEIPRGHLGEIPRGDPATPAGVGWCQGSWQRQVANGVCGVTGDTQVADGVCRVTEDTHDCTSQRDRHVPQVDRSGADCNGRAVRIDDIQARGREREKGVTLPWSRSDRASYTTAADERLPSNVPTSDYEPRLPGRTPT